MVYDHDHSLGTVWKDTKSHRLVPAGANDLNDT